MEHKIIEEEKRAEFLEKTPYPSREGVATVDVDSICPDLSDWEDIDPYERGTNCEPYVLYDILMVSRYASGREIVS